LLFAQISFESRAELEKAANAAFDAQDYVKAKPLFSQLLSLDAMEPNYNYRFGVCILYTEADPLKPLPYIEGGASSAGVKPEAHYFLGHAFQLNYRFDDAIRSYEKGKSAGLADGRYDLDRRIAECRNGKILYNEATEFKPAQEKEVIESEFYRPYDFRKLKGKVIPLPPTFKTKYDEKNLLGTVVYTPTNSTALVYASYGEDGANAKDLYRVNRLPSGEWALPQRLPNTINTQYDEDYAFFDEESQTLYFASKGHNTMGGYDVFSSRLDEGKGTWSTPVNLQYPINSPFDDFLYLSDPDGEVAFFTTARGTEIGKLKVIKTLLYDPVQVELSVVEGTFEDLTDSVYNYMVATVIDPVTKEVVGKFRSNKLTGKYVLILPPQQGYVMDVAPREADGFKFQLDIPKHEKYSPLSQQIAFDANAKDGVVTITNFFDAAGKPDTVANEVAMPVDKVVERMVAMPEPTQAMLAEARQQSTADDKLKQKEQEEAERKQEMAAARQKAVQDSLTQVAQAAQLKAAEEAKRQQQLAAARQDSIAKVELALKQNEQEEANRKQELAAARQKAVQDSLAQVAQATQLKAAEETQRQQQLAAARQDSIAKVELALKQKQQEEAKRKQEIAAARQKAVQDSLTQVAQATQLKVAEEAKRQQQLATARQDSIAKVELAMKQKEQEEAKRKQEIAAARQKAVQDSLAQVAQATQLKAAEEAKRQQQLATARQDSIAKVELALKQKQQEETIRKQELAAARQKAVQDSLTQVAQAAQLKAAEEAKRQQQLAAARQDSIAKVELALKQKQEDDLQKRNEKQLAERTQQDSLERERQLAFELAKKKQAQLDSANQAALLTKAEQEAKMARLKAQQDSLFNAQLAKRADELAAQEKRKDSIAAVEAAAAEGKLRIAEIEKEVELAQQKAMKDSMIAANEQQAELDYQQLKAEMAQQEAELLQQKPEEPTKPAVVADTKVEEKQVEEKTVEEKEVEEVAEAKSDTAAAALSDAELFLQTIAKLEKQMEERNRQLEEQAQAAQEAKMLADVQAAANPKLDETAPAAAAVEKTQVAPTEQTKEEPLDGTEMVALKSDADPNEYLAALNRIEQQMAADAASRPAKDYELRSMDELNGTATKQEADPALQAVIDADRKALEEHQLIAKQKEEEMRQKMQQDREVLTNYDQDFANEVLEAEKQVMEPTTQPVAVGSTEPVAPVVEQKVEEAEVSKAQIAAEMAAIEQELKAKEEPVVAEIVTAEETIETSIDTEQLAEETQAIAALEESSRSPEPKAEVVATVTPVVKEEAPKAEQPEVAEVKAEVVEPVVEPATEPTVEMVAEVVQKEAPKPEPVTEMVAEVVEEPKAEVAPAVEEIVNEVLLVETEMEEAEQPTRTVAAPLDSEAEIDRVAMLHLMPAALRDYSKRKADFSQIANLELRRMVQRMRAEEVGRLAVLKNVRNKWVDQGKTLTAAETLKQNNRNQDVLSNLTVTEPREEKVRPPFDRNDLRQRQDVLYRLQVAMVTTPVSDRVVETMSPEQAMTFAMPEVQLQTGYFRTLADARSGMFEYRSRGLGKVGIVAYHQGQPILLSDVDKIPFVD